jgi:hypothetical protein
MRAAGQCPLCTRARTSGSLLRKIIGDAGLTVDEFEALL